MLIGSCRLVVPIPSPRRLDGEGRVGMKQPAPMRRAKAGAATLPRGLQAIGEYVSDALHSILANDLRIPGHDNSCCDWGYCEYVYDPKGGEYD